MNKICSKYIREVKAAFPVKGKSERKYIKELTDNINEYCEEQNIKRIEALYEEFGSPIDVPHEYFSARGTPYIMKQLKVSKYIKSLVIVAICAIIAATATYITVMIESLKSELRSEIASVETVIENGEPKIVNDKEIEKLLEEAKNADTE